MHATSSKPSGHNLRLDPLRPLRWWLNQLTIQRPWLACLILRLIPAQCPFERDICILGRVVGHIPPLCKLNPIYDELVYLRFRALCYLVDDCGEDPTRYAR
ncbi:MAG TPA: Mo-dependent nitrogenase C-terminal domain-containing protein [Candidatus Obscuribacterales bacterium]